MRLGIGGDKAFWAGEVFGSSAGGDSPPKQPPTSRDEEKGWGADHRTILFIEDDRNIRDALGELLEEEGYRVVAAEDGRSALERLYAGARPDLIILDLRMPVMDGWEFRALQKADPALAEIPIVALSADGSAKAAAIDAHAYVRKPVTADALLAVVSKVFGEVDRKRLRGRLEEAERFAVLGRLAAGVGHEINNPLTYLSISIDLLLHEVEHFLLRPPETSAEAALTGLRTLLGDCRCGLDRIRDVVRTLESLSRHAPDKREAIALHEVIGRSLAMARHEVQHRAAVVEHLEELPLLVGDASALGQVFLNLILNATESLPAGRADQNRITIAARTQDDEVVVEISDTGPGIPLDVLPRIFDPFFTTKPVGEGTGLGLSISRQIVTAHGGRLDVESQLGRGTTFRVRLPTPDSGSVPTQQQHVATPLPFGPGGRVLVIDDSLLVGRAIEAALHEYEVTLATSAADAFARLEAGETFDLILCDLIMPNVSGQEVHQRLTDTWPILAERVVFMTAGAFTPEASRFLTRTLGSVLTKPFDVQELRSLVRVKLTDLDGRRH